MRLSICVNTQVVNDVPLQGNAIEDQRADVEQMLDQVQDQQVSVLRKK